MRGLSRVNTMDDGNTKGQKSLWVEKKETSAEEVGGDAKSWHSRRKRPVINSKECWQYSPMFWKRVICWPVLKINQIFCFSVPKVRPKSITKIFIGWFGAHTRLFGLDFFSPLQHLCFLLFFCLAYWTHPLAPHKHTHTHTHPSHTHTSTEDLTWGSCVIISFSIYLQGDQ